MSMFIADRDGENVVVGTKDGWMIFYAVETMEVIRYDRCGHDSVTVSSLLATSNGRVVSTALDVVRVWNPKTGMETVLCFKCAMLDILRSNSFFLYCTSLVHVFSLFGVVELSFCCLMSSVMCVF